MCDSLFSFKVFKVLAPWSVQQKKKNSINIVLCSFDVSTWTKSKISGTLAIQKKLLRFSYVDYLFAHKLLVLDLSSLLCLDYASWGLGSFGE